MQSGIAHIANFAFPARPSTKLRINISIVQNSSISDFILGKQVELRLLDSALTLADKV